MGHKKGFTLIELLVVIAIIALLLSILTPALRMAKENGRRLLCSSNLKSIGVGLKIYAESSNDKLIPNVHFNGTHYTDGIKPGYQPWQSYFLGLNESNPDFLTPVQLGLLFSTGIIDVPEIFYCETGKISLNDTGTMDYYTGGNGQIVKFMPPDKGYGWGVPEGDLRCRSNYTYWTWTETSFMDIPSHRAMVVDSMIKVPHRKGEKPYGINALFGDGHVNMTLVGSNPEIMEYVQRTSYDDKAHDYDGFVNSLRLLNP